MNNRHTPSPRVALVTYSTKPRGGVVHALNLAEALHRREEPVHLFALGEGGFYRPTDAPHTLFPAPAWAPTLEERVFRSIDALTQGLAEVLPGAYDVVHVEDCIAARAATHVRNDVASVPVVRTVHHIDDFTTPSLVECQHRSVLDPDHIVTVSESWRRELADLYDVDADVIHNGVDTARFEGPPPFAPDVLRRRIGATDRFLFFTVGGVEPRKGTDSLVEAFAKLRDNVEPPPIVATVGGHSFQDHRPYRERVYRRLAELELHTDFVELGTVSDEELTSWYHAADGFVFPSVKEGWGIAVLEAMAAGLPVVASDIPVFREYLRDEENALLAPAGDPAALAEVMRRVVDDRRLRTRLGAAGPQLAADFTWERAAERHAELYRRLTDTEAGAGAFRAQTPHSGLLKERLSR